MQLLSLTALLALAGIASAKLHSQAVCVTNRHYSANGGTPFSVSYNWSVNYEILPDATRCPDCHFDGLVCGSRDWHIGGDEFTYYCENKCGAQGAEAN
ncbi:hypothetical protein F53441_12192 [Fusarium austroafricanum]|uniref:Uncharacterized protein n=1 Tax=Fusarium austroafricanum TaxID=2364996 RepID=A0A8H4K1C0_9HYPO|nr:hypothetical protein F53441_12192 [Fusarium austroafricanum]